GVSPVQLQAKGPGRYRPPPGIEIPPCPPFSKGGSKSPFSKGGFRWILIFTVRIAAALTFSPRLTTYDPAGRPIEHRSPEPDIFARSQAPAWERILSLSPAQVTLLKNDMHPPISQSSNSRALGSPETMKNLQL